MTERLKLTFNRPRRASEETTPKTSPVYRKKVWVNPTPQKQAKKPKPQKSVKPITQKQVAKPKQEVKVKIPKPPQKPKKRQMINIRRTELEEIQRINISNSILI